jgi:putative autoinducer-2 (AI-2) aldolase
MGRNIFQSDAPAAMIQAVGRVVHERMKPRHALDFFLGLREDGRKKSARKTTGRRTGG